MASTRVLTLQLDVTDPPARLGEWLIDAGLELEVRDLSDGDVLPESLAEYGAVLVLGGGMGAFDDAVAPYLPGVRDLLRRAVTEEVPTLGVCLGAQLLAGAHGSPIRRNPDGPEIGAQLIAKRSAAAGDPLFRDLPITPDVLQWHYDAIITLPAGAVQLASSPGCEHQAFRLGRLAWGVQFHLETTPEIMAQWAAEDAANLDELGLDVDRILSRSQALHDDMAEVWPTFAQAFADVVRDPAAVAPPSGVPTSTAAPVTDPAAIRAALAAEAAAARGMLPMPTMRPSWDE